MQTVPTLLHAQRTHSLEISEIVQLLDCTAKLSASGQDTVLLCNSTPVVLPCDMDDRFRLTAVKPAADQKQPLAKGAAQ